MLYKHETLGELAPEQIHLMIKAKQDQRLLAAIQAQNLREAKITKLVDKDQTKFQKIGDRLVTRLAKIQEMLDKCEDELMDMQKITSQVSLYEDELGRKV